MAALESIRLPVCVQHQPWSKPLLAPRRLKDASLLSSFGSETHRDRCRLPSARADRARVACACSDEHTNRQVRGRRDEGEGHKQQHRYKAVVGEDWKNIGKDGLEGRDYLFEIGRQSSNMNTEVGARTGMIDSVFTGGFLGRDSDIASGELRKYDTRKFNNIVGDYYVAPRFLDKFALHIVKNFAEPQLDAKVPLILGIWGPKGSGKSFQVELCCKKMGIEPIVTSAGELEDEWAGRPGALLRERYRKCAEVVKNWGKMSCLIINDLDAGTGRFKDTQVTVNNQMVMGSLMALCDDPVTVSLGGDWTFTANKIHRVPIIITANDLDSLYAPLLRDGRMEKFYWEPAREDIIAMLETMYKDDNVSTEDLKILQATFKEQSLDFYGAIRSRLYDEYVRDWIETTGDDLKDIQRVLRPSMRGAEPRPGLPEEPVVTLEKLIEAGKSLAQEQQHVNDLKLSHEYMRWQEDKVETQEERVERERREKRIGIRAADAEFELARQSNKVQESAKRAREMLRKSEAENPFRKEQWERLNPAPEMLEEPVESLPWDRLSPLKAHDFCVHRGYTLIDIRPARDYKKECAKGAASVPASEVTGTLSNQVVTVLDTFGQNFGINYPDKQAGYVIYGDVSAEPDTTERKALEELVSAGYTNILEIEGGYINWADYYAPNGKKRPPKRTYTVNHSAPGTICVGAEFGTEIKM